MTEQYPDYLFLKKEGRTVFWWKEYSGTYSSADYDPEAEQPFFLRIEIEHAHADKAIREALADGWFLIDCSGCFEVFASMPEVVL
jgi:hypothetical protein